MVDAMKLSFLTKDDYDVVIKNCHDSTFRRIEWLKVHRNSFAGRTFTESHLITYSYSTNLFINFVPVKAAEHFKKLFPNKTNTYTYLV